MFKPKQQYNDRDEKKYFSEIIALRRVAKATSGAKRLRFSAVVAAGDKMGKIGIAIAKGADPQEALQKAIKKASASMFRINLDMKKMTIPHRIESNYKASRVILKPAPLGTGVVAGGSMRKVMELTGVQNVVAKRQGTANGITNAYCTVLALTKLKKVKHVIKATTTGEEK